MDGPRVGDEGHKAVRGQRCLGREDPTGSQPPVGGVGQQVQGQSDQGTLATHVVLEIGIEAFVTEVHLGCQCHQRHVEFEI